MAKFTLKTWEGGCMRSASKWIFLTMMAFFFVGGSGLCADVAKIGVVEFQRLFENSDAGKEIKTEITLQGKKMEAELKEKGAEIEEMKKRLEREAGKLKKDIKFISGKLGNPKFVDKAPADIVQKERDKLTVLEGKLANLQENIDRIDSLRAN